MNESRLLTKSRFRMALECPSKLYFTGKKQFANQSEGDPFLAALADGGFQIGQLAKAYFPNGIEIESREMDAALARTADLLAQDRVTIFEAAFRFENLLVFVDIVEKNGRDVRLIEVKSKVYERGTTEFIGKRGGILAGWQGDLYDIAFQKHVVRAALPQMNVTASLMLVDKTAACPSNGLNQKFRIVTNGTERRAVQTAPLTDDEFNHRILCEIPVDDVCDVIFTDPKTPFGELVTTLANAYMADQFIAAPISKVCKTCQFQATREDFAAGLESGRHFCWQRQLGLPPAELDQPTILDIWRANADKMIGNGKLMLTNVTAEDFIPKSSRTAGGPGLSTAARQWLQVEKIKAADEIAYLDRDGLTGEIATWKFPLHFIDFETATPAIPFNQGRRPYEEIAFQFSHHTVSADGSVAHVGQCLNTAIGEFPNFGFIRALKAELDKDDGTIFRYADHENTYLRVIRRQLQESSEEDRDELCAFIDSITSWTDGAGPRAMVDMLKLVLNYYYDPFMGGSNSIKKVLPAILRSSEYLQIKYSGSAYGTEIPSLNYYEGKSWVERNADGELRDPYDLLEKLFASEEFENVGESELKDGGAAMISYAQLQYEDMPTNRRQEIENALLRYCELDTLAMVMIYEGWREMLRG